MNVLLAVVILDKDKKKGCGGQAFRPLDTYFNISIQLKQLILFF